MIQGVWTNGPNLVVLNGWIIFLNGWPSRSNGCKFFWTDATGVRTDGQFFWTDGTGRSNGWMIYVNGWPNCSNGCKFLWTGAPAVRTVQQFLWTDDTAVRTDANFNWTDEKRLVNEFPFENGKPLVYVFAWEVTNITHPSQIFLHPCSNNSIQSLYCGQFTL